MEGSRRGGWGLGARTRAALALLILVMHGAGCGVGAMSGVHGPTARAAPPPLRGRGALRAATAVPLIPRKEAGAGRKGSGNSTGSILNSTLPRRKKAVKRKSAQAVRSKTNSSACPAGRKPRGTLGDRCLHPEGCQKRASFGYAWSEPRLRMYCAIHRLAGQVDVKHKRCSFRNCERHIADFKSGTCLAHVAVSPHARKDLSPRVGDQNRLCKTDGCREVARYGWKGGRNATSCTSHRQEGMVDVRRKSCAVDMCDGVATYGDPKSGTAVFCAKHRQEGQIDLKHKRCQFPLEVCMRQPSYGEESEGISRFCAAHKREGDVDVRSTPCRHAGCRRSASFGVEGSRKLIFCSQHRRDEHVNIRKQRRRDDYMVGGNWELLWRDDDSVVKFCRDGGLGTASGHEAGAHEVQAGVNCEEREEMQAWPQGLKVPGDFGVEQGASGTLPGVSLGSGPLGQGAPADAEGRGSGVGSLQSLRGGGPEAVGHIFGSLRSQCSPSKSLPVESTSFWWGLLCGQLFFGLHHLLEMVLLDQPTDMSDGGLNALKWRWGGMHPRCCGAESATFQVIRLRGGCSSAFGLLPPQGGDAVGKGAASSASNASEASKGLRRQRPRGNRSHSHVRCTMCAKTASFGLLSDKKRVTCKAHKEQGHVDLCMVNCQCRTEGCVRIASFGSLTDRVRLFCSKHKQSGHINLKNRLCDVKGCLGQALYGSDNDRRPLFCSEHRRPLDVDVRSKRCKTSGCRKQPGYHRDRCATHTRETNSSMNGSKTSASGKRLCEKEGCTTTASYGIDRVRVCTKHKSSGDRDLVSRMCEHPGCLKQASYVFQKDLTKQNTTSANASQQGLRPRLGKLSANWFCITHKPNGAIQARNRKCVSCDKTASFSFEGRSASVCRQHRQEGMINKRINHCQFVDGCNTIASYGVVNTTADERVVARFCGVHRAPTHVLAHVRSRQRNGPVGLA